MGKYIQTNSKGESIGKTFEEKLKNLVEDGAVLIDRPTRLKENLVCVVDNGTFAAAGYAYDEQELIYFVSGMFGRPHQWIIYKHAKELAQ